MFKRMQQTNSGTTTRSIIELAVRDAMSKHGPEVEAQVQAEHSAKRADLRERLATLEAEYKPVVESLRGRMETAEKEVEKLKRQIEAVEKHMNHLRSEQSNENDKYMTQRHAAWAEADEIPAPELVRFLGEIERRLNGSVALQKTWPSKFVDRGTGQRRATGNAESLDAYCHSLIRTRGRIDDAIHAALDGELATSFIAAEREGWAKVQVGEDEWIAP